MKEKDLDTFFKSVLKHSKLATNKGLKKSLRFNKSDDAVGGATAVIPTYRFLAEWNKLVKKTKKAKKL